MRSRYAVILGAKRRESMRSRHAVILGAKGVNPCVLVMQSFSTGGRESTRSRHTVILDRRE